MTNNITTVTTEDLPADENLTDDLAVETGVSAGGVGLVVQHAEDTADDDDLAVETGVSAGGARFNHSEDTADDDDLAVETGVSAGGVSLNHAEDAL